CLQYSTSPYRF
nr:immunoglobulin light chain junction region [Macaca mulatta]MOV63555.1 immunoglobulin light chain junction region [Macaca mulatta]MOV64361.1 immunoglobulin light chain junction region [Macaca mulatta]